MAEIIQSVVIPFAIFISTEVNAVTWSPLRLYSMHLAAFTHYSNLPHTPGLTRQHIQESANQSNKLSSHMDFYAHEL